MTPTHTWRRVEPGYYTLTGTDIEVANMKGQSVKYMGAIADPWHVRRGSGRTYRVIGEYGTLSEAKAAALKLT